MGKIYVCDICKEQFVEPYKIRKMKMDGHPELEICSACANKLVRYINGEIEFYSLEICSKEEKKDD